MYLDNKQIIPHMRDLVVVETCYLLKGVLLTLTDVI